MNEAYLNAPDDVLIGVGTCKVGGALSRLARGRVVKSELDGKGIMWVVMEYRKSAAAGEVRRIASESLRDFLPDA